MNVLMNRNMFLKTFFAVVLMTVCIGAAQANTLNIVATTSDIGCVARAIAGQRGEVFVICGGDRDAHYLQARPSYIMQARNADLWIRVGMELEIGWEPVVLDGARNVNIREGNPGHLDASVRVLKLEVPTQRVTRAMGDVHPSGNPHYWMDPLNMRLVAETLADRLIQLDPAHSVYYGKNLDAYKDKIDRRMFGDVLVDRFGANRLWANQVQGRLDAFLAEHNAADDLGGWAGAMRPLRGRKLVTYHKNWSYFANRFGIELVMELEPKPGIPPSPAHLARVIDVMNAQEINTILMAPIYPRRAADQVAARTGATVLIRAHSVGGTEAASDWFGLIDDLVNGLVETLQ